MSYTQDDSTYVPPRHVRALGWEPVSMTETLDSIARQLSTKYGDSYDDALRAVTSYAIDLGIDTGVQAGGQSPRTRVSNDDANVIIQAYRVARDANSPDS